MIIIMSIIDDDGHHVEKEVGFEFPSTIAPSSSAPWRYRKSILPMTNDYHSAMNADSSHCSKKGDFTPTIETSSDSPGFAYHIQGRFYECIRVVAFSWCISFVFARNNGNCFSVSTRGIRRVWGGHKRGELPFFCVLTCLNPTDKCIAWGEWKE